VGCWLDSCRIFGIWNYKGINLINKMIDIELLGWFGNLINFLVFTFISISIINSSCFDVFQMSLTLAGLLVSIFIQIVSLLYKSEAKEN